MLYHRILVAFDESALSRKALESAIKLAKINMFARIDVLHVVELPRANFLIGDAYSMIERSMFQRAEELMTYAKEQLAKIDNQTRTFIEPGVAFQVILHHAKEHNNDLIVMGSRGLKGWKEFLGSVSHYVVQHSKVPVLIIK